VATSQDDAAEENSQPGVLTLEEEDSTDDVIETPDEVAVSETLAVAEDAPAPITEPVSTEASDSSDENIEIARVPVDTAANLISDIETGSVPTESQLPIASAIQVTVESWVDSWQSQSLPDYFFHYHDEFAPRYQDTPSEWRANWQRVIGNAEWIRLQMSDFQLITEENGVYEVHFWLAYESPTYCDNTLKKLLLVLEVERWQILEEISLVVED